MLKHIQGALNSSDSAHKRKVATLGLGAIFLGLGFLFAVYWLIWGQFKAYTDDAYVNGNMVSLMAQTPGTVVDIKTDDTKLVNQGQLLIRLDKTNNEIALQAAKAELAEAVRTVRQYFENAQQAKQSVILDKANLNQAQLDMKRRSNLIGDRAVSREELQHYKTALDAAQANYSLSVHRLEGALALIQNTELYNHPLVEQAKAKMKSAYLNYKRTEIVAPVTGFVAKRNVQPGEQVGLNSTMLAIIPLDNTWVDANYKESTLNHLRVGQPVILYADAYPDVTYHGTVAGLNAGTGSAFALLPPQNATGNWIKIVQRLPVRIQLDPEELKKNPLQLGLSMRVTTYTRNRSGGRMPEIADTKFSFQTDAYANQLAEVNQLINQILEDNSANMYLPKEAPKRMLS